MSNPTSLRNWLWRWHIIAGVISLPFLLLLAVTGSIYLFKQSYEQQAYQQVLQVQPQGERISYDAQWILAQAGSQRLPNLMRIPTSDTESTEFKSGRFSGSRYLYIDPYRAQVAGEIVQQDTLMQKVRKLHGELLLGKYGTKVVELIASWMVVLILTGFYVWWPRNGFSWSTFLRVRVRHGWRNFLRDFHVVTGFWSALFLLIILAGGFPWTDVFGSNFKTVRDATGTGYPATWNSSKGLQSTVADEPLSLDQMVDIAQQLNLSGDVWITLPYKAEDVFTVSNRAPRLSDQQVVHLDRYSGEPVLTHTWEDVGALSSGRQVVMRLHQGEFFGILNWYLVLATAVFLALMVIASVSSYLIRKPAGGTGFPSVPDNFRVGFPLVLIIAALGVVFPLFGISVLVILVGHGLAWWWNYYRSIDAVSN